MQMPENSNRNLALDSLRGMAVMGILIWDYQHFFQLSGSFAQPYEEYLPFLYKFGWIMVDLFFCLSGYIFFSYYQKMISANQILFKDFMILRLSRLYPLIVLTLVVTAILNYLLFFLMGKFYIYGSNDFFSFFANLLFLQSGFFKTGFSFNALSWTLGVQFWIYLLFFAVAFYLKKNLTIITGLISIFFIVAFNNGINLGLVIFSPEFERGIGSFFLGGITHYLIKAIQNTKKINGNLIGFITFSIVVLGYALAHEKFSATHAAYVDAMFAHDVLTITLLLNPLLIISVTVSPLLNKIFSFRPLRFFGDISYSSYLWHVPIQLGIFLLILVGGLKLNPASNDFFFSYFLIVIFISFLSAKYFEKPLQDKIRSLFLK